ncbi:MAG: 30S ribosomal protein S2 [Candidatus Andersenbacteria bacterium]|nr:30S ribosomal protein S2 [Candidatus Andersenbacteria bacterium]MBI3250504.1 30S ribosomal protein S2 [Candidatus Andersenbacteria bacterium]
MLEAGVHFGHERSKRNPKMSPFIFTQRNRVAIMDLEQTRAQLEEAAKYVFQLASIPGSEILFVGTKRQAQPIIRKYAEAIEQPYVTRRWLGGTMTNFSTILKSIEKLEELQRSEKTGQGAKLTKKEKGVRRKEIQRLEGILEGIKSLKTLPSALFLASAYNEQIAIREAKRVGIPVIAITDTNANPELIDYPIAANDDAIRSIDLIVSVIAKSIAAAHGKELAL